MKKSNLGTGLVIALTASYAAAQGSLTPPGAPAPTMKTLDQVEPRTPISSLPCTIGQSGSYYLSKNLALAGAGDGITIDADNVTLDLMGFTLEGGDGSGIVSQFKNLVIKNGQLRGWGLDGIGLVGATGVVLKDLRSTDNGRDGFYVGANALVSDCVAAGNADDGFSSDAGNNRFVRCRSLNNYYGFYLTAAVNQLKECEALGCFVIGIYAANDSVLEDNTVIGNGGAGLQLDGTGSYIANNIVKGNGDNYSFTAGNQLNILLCEIPETLDWPCSVKLAGTLTCTQTGVNGITVAANDVTIDMAGHALVGPGASSGNGIYQDSAYRNLAVKNGKVVHWGGVDMGGISSGYGTSAIFSNLQVSSNFYGIAVGDGSTIHDCTAYNNISEGILTSDGCVIRGCAAGHNGGNGISVGWDSTICDCEVEFNGDNGIYAGGYGCNISGCGAQFNKMDGIEVFNHNRVTDCVCENNSYGGDGAGIHTTGAGNRIEGNNVTSNNRGIDVDGSGNFIVKNTASGNTTDYDIAVGNYLGTIQSTPVGADAWDNFSF